MTDPYREKRRCNSSGCCPTMRKCIRCNEWSLYPGMISRECQSKGCQERRRALTQRIRDHIKKKGGLAQWVREVVDGQA